MTELQCILRSISPERFGDIPPSIHCQTARDLKEVRERSMVHVVHDDAVIYATILEVKRGDILEVSFNGYSRVQSVGVHQARIVRDMASKEDA